MTYILFNPLANGGHGDRGVGRVEDALRAEEPKTMDITGMDTGAFLRGLSGEDKVILCGGDGTINRLVNDLDGKAPEVPIHVWRFGTGNDFIRDTAGKNGPNTVLLNDYMGNLPLAEFSGQRRFFLNGCSLGVDAEVCRAMEENRLKPKKSGYAATAVSAFFKNFRPVRGRVTVDGESREFDKIWMAGVMNGHYQGGGMKFAPDQDRNGDTVTSLVWHGTSAFGTLLHFPFVIPGKHTGFSFCKMRTGHEVTVELEEPCWLQMDGEVFGDVTGYTIRK